MSFVSNSSSIFTFRFQVASCELRAVYRVPYAVLVPDEKWETIVSHTFTYYTCAKNKWFMQIRETRIKNLLYIFVLYYSNSNVLVYKYQINIPTSPQSNPRVIPSCRKLNYYPTSWYRLINENSGSVLHESSILLGTSQPCPISLYKPADSVIPDILTWCSKNRFYVYSIHKTYGTTIIFVTCIYSLNSWLTRFRFCAEIYKYREMNSQK